MNLRKRTMPNRTLQHPKVLSYGTATSPIDKKRVLCDNPLTTQDAPDTFLQCVSLTGRKLYAAVRPRFDDTRITLSNQHKRGSECSISKDS